MWSRTVFTRARSFGRCFYSVHVPVRSSIFRYCGTPHPPNFEKCDSLVAHLAIPPLQTSNTLNFNGSRSYSTSSHQQKIPSDDVVLYDVNEATGIATITLNNPQKRNPLSCGVLDSLNGIVDEIEEDLRASRAEHHPSRVRVVVIKSTGPVFCSGHDFKDFTMDKGKDFHKKVLAACTRLNLRLQSVCPPTIAMVDGLATAAGCQLACSCDLVVATDTSRFCVPGSRNGGFCHTPGVSLSNKIHKRKALELLLLGDDLPAVEAARLGLVNRLVDSAVSLERVVGEWATRIASTSGYNTQMGKQCFYEHTQARGSAQQYEVASAYMLDMFASPDQQEGIDAFFGRRRPVWKS